MGTNTSETNRITNGGKDMIYSKKGNMKGKELFYNIIKSLILISTVNNRSMK